MNDFLLVVDSFFSILTQYFNEIISNWFTGLLFLIFIFGLIVNLFLMIKGTR